MRKKQAVPFSKKFPKADPAALRLLQRLIAFDPKDRPSAEEVSSTKLALFFTSSVKKLKLYVLCFDYRFTFIYRHLLIRTSVACQVQSGNHRHSQFQSLNSSLRERS